MSTAAELIEGLGRKFDGLGKRVDDKLEAFGEKMEAVTIAVTEVRAKCEQQGETLAEVKAEVLGVPGDGNGLKGDVASLIQSRWYTRWALRGVWALLLLGIGAAGTLLFAG